MGNNGEPPPGVPAPGGRVVVIRPAAVLGGTILAAALLTAAHLGLTRFRPPPGTWTVVSVLRPLFDLDQEGTIPVWYSGTLLFLAGAAAFARGSYLRRADRRSHWRVYLAMAAGFTALSVDEVAQVHERVNAAAAAAAGRQGYPLLGGRSEGLTAVAVYAAAALAGLVLLRRDVAALAREPAGRAGLAAGAATYLAGGVVVDNLLPGHAALEEFLEMAGAGLMLYALVVKMGPLAVAVGGPPDDPVERPPAGG